MTLLARVMPVLLLLCAGCASAPQSKQTRDDSQQKGEIQSVLNQIIEACEKKDLARLDTYHLYGPKFTKFDTGSPNRLDAVAARDGEHKGLTAATDLRMHADDLDIEIFGNTGISTFTLSYTFKTETGSMQKKTRATLVFVKDQGSWKIAHEHLSSLQDTHAGSLSNHEAALLAARLANDQCDRQYHRRPFTADQHPAVLAQGIYRWGSLDVGGVGGFSALVTFRPDSSDPHVEVYFSSDALGAR
jgi:ketosteroid isomerase-like protein